MQFDQVFVASRFSEFEELRKELCSTLGKHSLAAIDLNDGLARSVPPLRQCLRRVRQSNYMILLLGDSYGPVAPGRDKSFTYLEYREAMRAGSKTSVFVFVIQPGEPERTNVDQSQRPAQIPAAWWSEIFEKQTPRRLCRDSNVKAQVSEIINSLLGHIHARRLELGESGGDGDAEDADTWSELPEDTFDDSEIEHLEATEAYAQGKVYSNALDAGSDDEAFVARNPAAVAALEQRNEAQQAIQLREYGIARRHLRRALELRPLDGLACFWLARLYVVSARTDLLEQAVNLAERAARIAEGAGLPYRTAASFLLAARASALLDEPISAHRYVDEALDRAKFAHVYIERARVFCLEAKTDKALECAKEAFKLRNATLYLALRDPYLKPIRGGLEKELSRHKRVWRRDVEVLFSVERKLSVVAEQPMADQPELTPADGLAKLRRLGQASMSRQHALVSHVIEECSKLVNDALPDRKGSTGNDLAKLLGQMTERLNDAREHEAKAEQALARASVLPRLFDGKLGMAVLASSVLVSLLANQTAWWAHFVAVLIGLAVLPLAGQALWNRWKALLVAREALDAARAARDEVVADTARARAALTEIEARRTTLEQVADKATALAQKALWLFEEGSLSRPARYLPSTCVSLRRARQGKLIRISDDVVRDYEANHPKRVELDRDFWVQPGVTATRYALYRVTAESPRSISLSRARAYRYKPGHAGVAAVNTTDDRSEVPPRHSRIRELAPTGGDTAGKAAS